MNKDNTAASMSKLMSMTSSESSKNNGHTDNNKSEKNVAKIPKKLQKFTKQNCKKFTKQNCINSNKFAKNQQIKLQKL